MMKFSSAVVAMLVTMTGTALAQQKQAASGKETFVWEFFNCQNGRLGTPSGTASNGTVNVREATSNRCGNPNQPVQKVFYTSKPGFKGTDTVFVYLGPNRNQITVNVK